MSHPREQLTDYLLGDLPPEQMREVDAHLAQCAACREELERLAAGAVAMVESLPPVTPPERVWAGISRRIAGDAPRPAPDAAVDDREAATAGSGAGARLPRPPAVPPLARPAPAPAAPPPRPQAPAWPLWALAASLLLAGAGVWYGLDRQQQLADQRRALQELQAQLATTQSANAALSREQDTLARWLARGDVVARTIAEASDSPIGTVLYLPDGRALVVMREAAPSGRNYQAWGVKGDDVTPLGVTDGRTLEVPSGGFDAIAVSLEPPGGSDTPTQVLGGVPTS